MEPLRPAAKRYLVTIVLAALATALVALSHVSALNIGAYRSRGRTRRGGDAGTTFPAPRRRQDQALP